MHLVLNFKVHNSTGMKYNVFFIRMHKNGSNLLQLILPTAFTIMITPFTVFNVTFMIISLSRRYMYMLSQLVSVNCQRRSFHPLK